MTRRNIGKRIRDLDEAGTAREWPEAIEIVGVPATEVDEDRRSVKTEDGDDGGDEDADPDETDQVVPDFEDFSLIISTGIGDDGTDEEETATGATCSVEGCENATQFPDGLDGLCWDCHPETPARYRDGEGTHE